MQEQLGGEEPVISKRGKSKGRKPTWLRQDRELGELGEQVEAGAKKIGFHRRR